MRSDASAAPERRADEPGPSGLGRVVRNLSPARHRATAGAAAPVVLRDGTRLWAEVVRPDAPGRFPALVTAAALARGASSSAGFFAERGYVHVVVSLRGVAGSEGEPSHFDDRERRDLFDVIEWAAAQPWCDGAIGMIGAGPYGSSQLAAAVERPPHLRAAFAVSAEPDLYPAYYRHGLLRVDAGHSAGVPAQTLVEHQARDGYWDARTVLPQLAEVDLPIYLAAHWDDLAGGLPGAIAAWDALMANPDTQLTVLPRAVQVEAAVQLEALAWFDLWLRRADTGADAGPPVRFWLAGAEQWRAAPGWPPNRGLVELALGADGDLGPRESPGARDLLCLAPAAVPSGPSGPSGPSALPAGPDLPDLLVWTSPAVAAQVDIAGGVELRLWATSTASDTAWMAVLQVVGVDGAVTDISAGGLRASMREVNRDLSRPGAPVLDCRSPTAVPIGRRVEYRVPMSPMARRLAAGERLRLAITSDDTGLPSAAAPAFRHHPVGTSARNTVHSTSRLLLPLLSGEPPLWEPAARTEPGPA